MSVANTKQTQLEWVKRQLRENGEVTRNQALREYITRLGARIDDLKNEGWKIEGEFVKTPYGKDYRYKLKVAETLWEL